MMRVLLCVGEQHDLRLVALALAVCLIGSAATVQLFSRIRISTGGARYGWIALTAVGSGATVWCTHFVAMLAFETEAAVMLDPILTFASLIIAIFVAAPGLALAAQRSRAKHLAGGAIVGIAVSTMHYTGMAAYRIDGIIRWDWRFVVASIVLSSTLSAAAFHLLHRRTDGGNGRIVAGGGLLGLSVVTLHFTGMAAMTVVPLALHGGLDQTTRTVLAITNAFAALLVIGCAAVSGLIDSHTRSETYRRLRRMAHRDSLTDLPNRASFDQELRARLEELHGNHRLAVVMIDLSRFKSVNDTHGHQAGDQLLVALAARFTAMVGPEECLSRLGGDEFAALKPYRDRAQLDDFLARVRAAFDAPFTLARFSVRCGASIGVALAPADGADHDVLLANADLAMYRAKAAHSPEPCFYERAMDDTVRDRWDLANQLRAAIGSDQFSVHFQVQAAIATGEISGYEALLRWDHPHRGSIPPDQFIPLAEETGAIVALGKWVLHEACRLAAAWPDPHMIAVNLSPLQLADPLLIDTVRGALAAAGLPPSRLELELTESAIIHDRQQALHHLSALKAMGVALALDDFGVGYSSLDVLRSFPFDRLKLDASFVAQVEESTQGLAILRSVAALGRTLGVSVLAEGIETPTQLAIVADAGCEQVQGYLLGRPAVALAAAPVVRLLIDRIARPGNALTLVA